MIETSLATQYLTALTGAAVAGIGLAFAAYIVRFAEERP